MKKALLAIVSLSAAVFAHAQCTELFFSEIVEGSGNNKAIEIYNPTAAPITLSNYWIVRYSNGSTVGTDSLQLNGTIAAHDVWVVANGQTVSQPNSPACDTALQAMADQLGGVYPDPLYQNGDDAIVLKHSGAIIDIFGKIGEDPGTAWTDVFPYTDAQGAWITKDHSMIRKSTVTGGVMVNPIAFNVMAEYDTLPQDNWTNLGIHNSLCNTSGIHEAQTNSSVSAYPNPSNGTFTITATTGMVNVEIYNALGELVFAKRVSGSTQEYVDLSAQPAGLYVMRVELTNGRRSVSKVSVQ